jgi:hypothetical protein
MPAGKSEVAKDTAPAVESRRADPISLPKPATSGSMWMLWYVRNRSQRLDRPDQQFALLGTTKPDWSTAAEC